MPPEPVPAEPEWDDDPAWSRPDPMTAAELEAALDRVCEHDEPPGPDEFEDVEPFTAEELAEIREAAADELLAVEAATTGRRGPGQPGSARIFPGESASPAAGVRARDAAGRAARLRGPGGRRGRRGRARTAGSPGCPRLSWSGCCAAWDRVEAHAAARKLAAAAELARRNPAPEDREFTADQVAYALAESHGRAGDPDRPGPDPRNPAARHRRGAGTTGRSPGTRPRSSPAPPPCSMTPRPAPPSRRSWTGPARLTPGGLRAAIAARGDGRRTREGEGASRGRGQRRPGGAVGRGFRQRRADGLRAAPGRGAGRGPADHRLGEGAAQGRAGGRHGRAARPRLPRLAAGQGLASPPGRERRRRRLRARPGRVRPGGPGRVTALGRTGTHRVRRAGHPDRPAGHPAGLADRPGEIPGIGPVDPWLARDLAAAAAQQPEDDLVRDRDRPGRPRRRARLRPARTQGVTGNAPDPARRDGPGSPSRPPAGTGRPAATAPGGCAPPATGPA